MANFSQLRRRQSSREILYRSQLSEEFEERRRHHSISGRPPISSNQRYSNWINEGLDENEEISSLMWEMRPRYATSAGELKRQRNKEGKTKTDIESLHQEQKKAKTPKTRTHLDTINDESEAPSRISSVSQFSQPPDEHGGEVRESWDSKLTFILATIGYAVGLGNIWRFPYLAQKNGGGAFLIPYWIMLFAEGLPLFLLELAIGQRLRKGSIGVWKQISPYLGGIGIASGVVSFNVALYYNTIIAWCLNYFVRSFQFPLPWSKCPTIQDNSTFHSFSKNMFNESSAECGASSPTEYFWYRQTLDVSGDINDPGKFNFVIAGCLIIAWVLVYLCIIKGITENPKVIYVTAIYPYIVLVIFFFRAITLEGMEDGVIHLFRPKWSRLADPVVWLEAGTQIFFSLGLAFGGLIAYSSYNPVNNNCTRDALLVAFTNCCTSMFAGIVIFAIMGYKANVVHKSCLEKQKSSLLLAFGTQDIVVPETGIVLHEMSDGKVLNESIIFCSLEKELENSSSGTGLAFILFTEAMNQFPAGNLWAVLFFLMLFTLGLDSQFGTLQGVVQCVIDLKILPNARKEVITGIICALCLAISMVFSHGAGNYVFTLFDNFAGSVPLLVIALFECISISYVYGLNRFSRDIEMMTGSRPNFYWLLCWKYISPLAMLGILIASVIDMIMSGAGYDAWDAENGTKIEKEWPIWCQLLIGFLICLSVMWIPLVAILKFFGITLLKPEVSGWFPTEELKIHYNIKDHVSTKSERFLFGFQDDGQEGICFLTKPQSNTLEPDPPKILMEDIENEL